MNSKTLIIYLSMILASIGYSDEKINRVLGVNQSASYSNNEIQIKDFVIKKNVSSLGDSDSLRFAAHRSHGSHGSHGSHRSHQSGR